MRAILCWLLCCILFYSHQENSYQMYWTRFAFFIFLLSGWVFILFLVLFCFRSDRLLRHQKWKKQFHSWDLGCIKPWEKKSSTFFYSSVFGLNGGCEKRSIEITKAQKCVRIEKHVQMPIILFYLSLHSITSETTTRTIQTNTTFFLFSLSILTSPSQSHACIHNTARMFMCQFCWDVFSLQTQAIIHVALFNFHLCRHVNDKSALFGVQDFNLVPPFNTVFMLIFG